MPLFVWFDLFLEASAEMQKSFCSIFGSNEDFKICVRGLMNFMNFLLAKYEGRSYLIGHIVYLVPCSDENQSSSQEFSKENC